MAARGLRSRDQLTSRGEAGQYIGLPQGKLGALVLKAGRRGAFLENMGS